MKARVFLAALAIVSTAVADLAARRVEVKMSDYGIVPHTGADMTPALNDALSAIKTRTKPGDKVTLRFEPGRYDFHAAEASRKEYYISNHDQDQPKPTVFCLEGWNGLTLEGNGAEFHFHGRLIPVSLVGSSGCTLHSFSIDFDEPQIGQAEVVRNDTAQGITIRMAPWTNYRITESGGLEMWGEGWANPVQAAIAFEKDSRHIVYRTGDIGFRGDSISETGPREIFIPGRYNGRLVPGTILALRSWYRPCPGIFMSDCTDTRVEDVTVHYAEGMGLLAQKCTDITLDGFNVCLRGRDDPRYFTTQADATHFSQCKGHIRSENGLYEHMMDDAINVHGVYLNIKERIDDQSVMACYEHGQTWGFGWGAAGDDIQFIRSQTMESAGKNVIASITPLDGHDGTAMRAFVIRFRQPLPPEIGDGQKFGIENLTWTPAVTFKGNTIRNNRARGALFSSPRRTIVEDNLFDHTSGSAILLCGDCNGWYESGSCRDMTIRRNTFHNALTSLFQFTNAVISIAPEIPQPESDGEYFHGGRKGAIRITDNTFATFDKPLLYARSVDGLVFKRNKVITNNDFPAFHWNKESVNLGHASRTDIRLFHKNQ